MCVWNDKMIIDWAQSGGITPFEADCVNPASIDLRWSGKAKKATAIGYEDAELTADGWLIIEKGELYLIDTLEYIVMPDDACGSMMLKSSRARDGLEHNHAGFFDPSFEGTATLEVTNTSPIPFVVWPQMRLVQLKLERMAALPEVSYAEIGHYNGQKEPKQSWYTEQEMLPL